MTNDEIQEASRLISEIGILKGRQAQYRHSDTVHIARFGTDGYGSRLSLDALPPGLVEAIFNDQIKAREARLNDLRAGC